MGQAQNQLGMGASRLVGRDAEMAELGQALAEAARHRGALFVTGAPGIGKTSLLDAATTDARDRGYKVLAVTGLESEADLPYAGLHQLLQPVLLSVGALPGPQKSALLTALGMRAGAPPDVFLVGLATLSLMGEVADEKPLVVVADDFQSLDGATTSVLSFVARPLESPPLLLIACLPATFKPPLPSRHLPQLPTPPLTSTPSTAPLSPL